MPYFAWGLAGLAIGVVGLLALVRYTNWVWYLPSEEDWWIEGEGDPGWPWGTLFNRCPVRLRAGGYAGRCDLKRHPARIACTLERGMEMVRTYG